MNDGRETTQEVVWPVSGKRKGNAVISFRGVRRGLMPAAMLLCLLSHTRLDWGQAVHPDGNGGGGTTTPVLSLSSSGSPSIYGNAITFTATLLPQSCASSAAYATFLDNGNTLGTGYWTFQTAGVATAVFTTTIALAAGSHTIHVTAQYPGGANCLAPVPVSITQTVNQAAPSITVASSSNPSNYGNAVTFTATVPSGDTNQVTFLSGGASLGAATPSNGKATLTTASLLPGSNSIAATIAAGGNYLASTSSAITQTVNPGPVTVSAWPTAGAITYGQALSSSALIGGTASVSGTFAWTTPGTIPAAGTPSESVTFTPSNTTDYAPVAAAVSVTVSKATPVISWATPAPINVGTALSATQLDATSSIAGTFSYSPAAGSVLSAGSQILSVTFTPSTSNAANYTNATATVTLTVSAYDAGTVTLIVGNSSGNVFSSSTSYGQGSTASSVAAGLAASNANIRVTAVNDTLFIEAAGTGASTDYSYVTIATWNSAVFAQPSFQGSPASGNLAGGANANNGSQSLVYGYSITTPSGGSGYDPAGNIVSYGDTVMGVWSTASSVQSCNTNTDQQSGYDCLNRLTTLHNTAVTPTSTQYAGAYFCWSYDAFGNRTAQVMQTSPCPASSSLSATADYNANNQVTRTSVNMAASGFAYDAAGNVMNDNRNQYLYDGEGRVCAVKNIAVTGLGTMIGYLYDPDGNRVAKGTITTWSCDPKINGLMTPQDETEYILDLDGRTVTEMAKAANGVMQWQRSFVYAGSELIGTYDPSPNPAYNPSNPGGQLPVLPALSFRLTDWQGTLRTTTDAAGVPQGTCTSLPFGDDLTCQGNIPDGHHFTGKERDDESGNDYFGARYYTSDMGRFLTPDWAAKPTTVPYASFGDPQTLNLYSYTENGPLNRVDAEGHAGQELAVGSSSSQMISDPTCTSGGSPSGGGGCLSSQQLAAALDGNDRAIYDAAVRDDVAQQQASASSGNNAAQQQLGQDPTIPTAVAPPSNAVDTLMNAIFPKSWGDMASLALAIPTDGLAEGAAPLAKTMKMSSSIGEDSKLVKFAEEAGKSVQKGLDSLTKELSKGNTNPGLGTKSLGNGISYARARDGARVFFQQSGNQIEILAKASKANETTVINYLKSLFR